MKTIEIETYKSHLPTSKYTHDSFYKNELKM